MKLRPLLQKKQTPLDLDPFLAGLGLKNAVNNSTSQEMDQEISIFEIAQNLKKISKKSTVGPSGCIP